jgi:hypothetical protein
MHRYKNEEKRRNSLNLNLCHPPATMKEGYYGIGRPNPLSGYFLVLPQHLPVNNLFITYLSSLPPPWYVP